MASEKKTSIYSDRGTIGSPEELDEYGVWVKSEPQDLSSIDFDYQKLPEEIDRGVDLPEVKEDFAGEDFSVGDLPDFDISFPEEGLLPDLPESEDAGEAFNLPEEFVPEAEESPPDTAGFEEVPSDDFSPQEPDLPLADVSMEDFLDNTPLGSLPPLLEDPVVEAPFSGSPREEEGAGPKAPDLSTQLLMRIADELSSIKVEISTLKEELSVFRRGDIPREEPKKDTESRFFDEEVDEKIALTGDEIDNILNTADFTEEAGEDAAKEVSMELSPMDFSPGEEPPESGEADLSSLEAFPEISFEELAEAPAEVPAEVPAGEEPAATEDFGGTSLEEAGELELLDLPEIDIDDDFADIELLDIPGAAELLPEEGLLPLPVEEPEDIKLLQEEGAAPITEIPEDISYLEEDPLTADSFGVLDLSDAVIDEPNISGDLIENVLQEPVPESIAIDPEEDEKGDLFIEDENAVELLHEDGEKTIDISLEPIAVDQDLQAELPPEVEEAGASDLLDKLPVLEEPLDVEEPPDLEEPVDVEEPLDLEEPVDVEEPRDLEEPADVEEPRDLEEPPALSPEPVLEETGAQPIPDNIKQELKVVLSYMDQLLESLPDEKIEEFARSEHFTTYKKLFEELGLV